MLHHSVAEAINSDQELADEFRRRYGATGRTHLEGHRPRFGVPEAIIKRFYRPSLLIWEDRFDPPTSETWRHRLDGAQDTLAPAIRAVGQVEIPHAVYDAVGTAWMVAPRIAVTNRHVAEFFARPSNGAFVFLTTFLGSSLKVNVDFREEHDNLAVAEVRVEEVLFMANPRAGQPDIAFLLMAGDNLPDPIRPAPETALRGSQMVATVGYPQSDSRNNADDQHRIFGGVYGVKRLAPGFITKVTPGGILLHDCTTLGGSSGSVVLDLESGGAVGLHFAGREGHTNFAVAMPKVLQMLAAYVDQTEETPVGIAPKAAEVETPSPFTADQLWSRNGYQPDFLELSKPIPLPEPRPGGRKAISITRTDGASTTVLPYHNFSVVMDDARKLAMFTAVNIDGAQLIRLKRGSDRWFRDPRLPAEAQMTNVLYRRNPLDRGHLVRRLDPCWGKDDAVAQSAQLDTFYWTNCAPQHAHLNQELWLGLEDYILDSAETHGFKASVFTGPVFNDGDDPKYRELTQIPQSYWKVVMMVAETPEEAERHLVATAYMLTQSSLLTELPPEFEYGAYGTYQLPLARLAKLTGLEFAEVLLSADPVRQEGAGWAFRLTSLDDVTLTAQT